MAFGFEARWDFISVMHGMKHVQKPGAAVPSVRRR
jgi:hypothetical protein